MQRLGFSTICRSTLSDANQKRPLAILEDVLQATLRRAKLSMPKASNFSFGGQVLALDSTIIELCLALIHSLIRKRDFILPRTLHSKTTVAMIKKLPF